MNVVGSVKLEHRLKLVRATKESLAGLAELVAPAGEARSTRYYDNAVEIWDVPGVVTDADASISVARVHPRPNRVVWMERHFKHTQLFMPLNGTPFVMVLAPPTEAPIPRLEAIRAYRFDGRAGVMLNIGTWHEFPFALRRPAEIAVVLRNETNRDLEAIENGEAVGGDLEKRNLAARHGAEIRF